VGGRGIGGPCEWGWFTSPGNAENSSYGIRGEVGSIDRRGREREDAIVVLKKRFNLGRERNREKDKCNP